MLAAHAYVALADEIRRASGPVSQVALAERLKLPRTTVQRRLADLEAAGIVRRTQEGYVPVGGAQCPGAHTPPRAECPSAPALARAEKEITT
ncbi:MAG: helix-turn-helix transcriptional regulator [Planctomycetota bacterium]